MIRTTTVGLVGLCLAAAAASSCGHEPFPEVRPPEADQELHTLAILVDTPPEVISAEGSCNEATKARLKQDMLPHVRRVLHGAGLRVVTVRAAAHDAAAKLLLRLKSCDGDHEHMSTEISLEANGVQVAIAEATDPNSDDSRNFVWTIEQTVRRLVAAPGLRELAAQKAKRAAAPVPPPAPPPPEPPPCWDPRQEQSVGLWSKSRSPAKNRVRIAVAR
jgi:hypothetical protein